MALENVNTGERSVIGTTQWHQRTPVANESCAPPPPVASISAPPQFLEAAILGFSSEGT